MLTPVKRFRDPDALYGTAVDSSAGPNMIGLQVAKRVALSTGDGATLRVDLTLTNTSDTAVTGLDVGWFSDWDLGVNSGANRVALVSASVQERTALQSYWSTVDSVAAAMAVWSEHADAAPIAAGIDNAITYSGFLPVMKDALLASGTSTSFDDVGDVAGVTGMHFDGPILPGESRTLHLCIAIASSADSANARAQRCMNELTRPEVTHPVISAYPNPASAHLNVVIDAPSPGAATLRLVSVDGRSRVFPVTLTAGRSIHVIDVSGVASGAYLVTVDILGDLASTAVQVLR
jgi:hypothetical protein